MKRKILDILLITTMLTSCQLRPLIDPEATKMSLLVETTLKINNDLKEDIDEHLIYPWDESKYGILTYTSPILYNGLIYRIGTKKELAVVQDFTPSVPERILVEEQYKYSVLFYNKLKYTTVDNDKDFTQYIARTGRKTKSEVDYTKINYSEKFNIEPQAEEMFCAYCSDILSGKKIERVETDELTARKTYGTYYEIEVDATPITYIYIIQVAIEDDDKSIPMDIVSCKYMGMSGVAAEGELLRHKTTRERCLIESYDIKPLSKYKNYSMFAERFTTFGLINSYDSSWGYEELDYELGLVFIKENGEELSGKFNITGGLLEKTQGGVITIILKNSVINKQAESSGGFDINVKDWDEEVKDIDL